VLVDVSSELIETALKEFESLYTDCEVHFSILDFENMAALQGLRQDFLWGMPVLTLLLGNTLGNLDEVAVLGDVCGALTSGDVVLAEMLLIDPTDLANRAASEGEAKDDERFEFVTTPLRLIGVDPCRENLFKIARPEPVGRLTDTFQYRFREISTPRRVADVSGSEVLLTNSLSINLLEIKAVTPQLLEGTGKRGGLSDVEVVSETYQLDRGPPIQMGYLLGRIR